MKRLLKILANVCKRKNITDYTMFITECVLCEKNSVKNTPLGRLYN